MKDKTSGKYLQLWRTQCPAICKTVAEGGGTIQLSKATLESGGGDRQDYTFRLYFIDGLMAKKPDTAVGRDLKGILQTSIEFLNVAKGKAVTIRLDSEFVLRIEVSSI